VFMMSTSLPGASALASGWVNANRSTISYDLSTSLARNEVKVAEDRR